MKTVVFTINRTPTPLLKNKSPYEILFSKVIDYNALKVFGCLTYASTLPSKRDKFTQKAVSTVFLGYPSGLKGYKLYDLTIISFLISRDVVLHENTFPFHSLQNFDSTIDPFPNIVMPLPIPDISTPIQNPPNTEPTLNPEPAIEIDIAVIPEPEPAPPLLRRSNRQTRPPSYRDTYHCIVSLPIQ